MLAYNLQFLQCLSIHKLCQFDIESSETTLRMSPVAEQCTTNISPELPSKWTLPLRIIMRRQCNNRQHVRQFYNTPPNPIDWPRLDLKVRILDTNNVHNNYSLDHRHHFPQKQLPWRKCINSFFTVQPQSGENTTTMCAWKRIRSFWKMLNAQFRTILSKYWDFDRCREANATKHLVPSSPSRFQNPKSLSPSYDIFLWMNLRVPYGII